MFLLVPAHPGSPGQRAIKMLFYVELYQTNRVSDSVEAFSYFHIFYLSVKVFCIFFMKLEHTCMMWILFMISLCSHILCSDLTSISRSSSSSNTGSPLTWKCWKTHGILLTWKTPGFVLLTWNFWHNKPIYALTY